MPTGAETKTLAQALATLDNYLEASKENLIQHGVKIGFVEQVKGQRVDATTVELKSKALLFDSLSSAPLATDNNLYETFIEEQRASLEAVRAELKTTVEAEFTKMVQQEPALWPALQKKRVINHYQSFYASEGKTGFRTIQMLAESLIDRQAVYGEVDAILAKNDRLAQHPEKLASRREQAFQELFDQKKPTRK